MIKDCTSCANNCGRCSYRSNYLEYILIVDSMKKKYPELFYKLDCSQWKENDIKGGASNIV